MLNSIKPPIARSIPTCRSWLWAHCWVVLCSRFLVGGFIRCPEISPLLDLSVMSQSWRLACPQTFRSTIRSHAGQCRARPLTGRAFAPVGFDFTLSALSFHFQHSPAIFLLPLSVDNFAM